MERKKDAQNAVLVAVVGSHTSLEQSKEHLRELAFLATTLQIHTEKSFVQKLEKPNARTFIGSGKLDEIITYIQDTTVGTIIFDDDLSPSQLRNIEKVSECKVYDRSLLILDIFLQRAQTSQAKTQVELARFQYLLPRLTRMWTHLERQRGSTSTRGGAGEKEIETDRRIIRRQISVLEKKLAKIQLQNNTQKKQRTGIVKLALVGYTNVGKSSLMELLCKTKVLSEDKLFATVDSKVKRICWQDIPFLLSDTVGFIRKLPHHLIESFKSTLDEVRDADILLHVVDISHPIYKEQMQVVQKTLAELSAADKTVIEIFNKVDALELPEDVSDVDAHMQELLKSIPNPQNPKVFISVRENQNIQELKQVMLRVIGKKHRKMYPNYLDHTI